MIRTSALALLFGATLASVSAAHSQTLTVSDNTYQVGDFGLDGTSTYGETFTAPGTSLTSFTFNFAGSGTVDVTAQVYAWYGPLVGDSAGDQGTIGAALFSEAETISSTSLTVETGGVALTAGQNYVILLTNPDSDNNQDWNLDLFDHPTAGDGGFVFNNGPATGEFDVTDFGSLQYTATFSGGGVSATPEPSSLALLGTGVLGLAGIARRRFNR